MKRRKLFRQHLIIATFALSLLATALAPAQPVDAAAKKAAQVKTVTVKNVSTTKAKVSWKKAKNAKSYQVSIATDKKFKKGKKTYNTKALSKNISKLKAGKKYYVRVRAKAKKWGKWSSVKTFKLPVAKKAAKKPATTKKPANNSGGNSNSNPMYTPEKTTPSKPTGCQHDWEFSANLNTSTLDQHVYSGCNKDITEFHENIKIKPQTKTINGISYTYTAANSTMWGLKLYDLPEYDIPCPVCGKYCGPTRLKSATTMDELTNNGQVKDHTKATCKYCGEVRLSGDPDFPSGYTTYE